VGYSLKQSTTQKVAEFKDMGENMDDLFGVHSGVEPVHMSIKALTIINSLIYQFRDTVYYM